MGRKKNISKTENKDDGSDLNEIANLIQEENQGQPMEVSGEPLKKESEFNFPINFNQPISNGHTPPNSSSPAKATQTKTQTEEDNSDSDFAVGEIIEALHEDGTYHDARIIQIYENGTYDVEFLKKEEEVVKPLHNCRHPEDSRYNYKCCRKRRRLVYFIFQLPRG